MRWSIIRLIWLRELRDQLRDRRTLFMIAVLPVFIYPLAGFGFMSFVAGYLKKTSKVEVLGADNLPPSPLPAAARLALGPSPDPAGYPPLLVQDGDVQRFSPDCFESPDDANNLDVTTPARALPDADPSSPEFAQSIDRSPLTNRTADLIVVVPPGFAADVEAGRQPRLYVIGRPGDDRSSLVNARVTAALNRWKAKLTATRLTRAGLPATYNEPFDVKDPDKTNTPADAARELSNLLVRVFPFILVMWSLAGALYPAVDLCAGEKERGTMETLLISPASRTEIVWGKFLTIWVFSAATALLNLFSIALTTMQFMKLDVINPFALAWGVLLLLPLSAFFSAVCLAVGAYARSSKEGQYYLMPLFLVTMPLIFLTLAPDVTLNPFYSMVPITGVALLLQKLMVAKPEQLGELSVYFVPVLGPMVIYSWLALRWAVEQFQREEVLFREAERLDLGLMLRNMFRDKEPLPSTGQALFCFVLLLVLSWLALSFGGRLDPLVQQGVRYLAFVAAPPLFMALFVTSRPRQTLGLRAPPWWAWPAAAVLAVLLFLPLMEYARYINQVEAIQAALKQFKEAHPEGVARGWPQLAVAALGALAEELAFRGFILSGLRRRFSPWMAVLVSSFLFGLSQMNVFQFVPHFVAGAAMGFLVVRTGSVLPAMLCHLVFNLLAVGPLVWPELFDRLGYASVGVEGTPALTALAVAGLLGAAALVFAFWRWAPPGEGAAAPVADGLPAEKLAEHASR
jgi:sodium transport system permease protein